MGLIFLCPALAGAAGPRLQVAAHEDAAKPPLAFVRPNAILKLENPPSSDLRGWDYLAARLSTLGIEPRVLYRVLSDPRMPRRDPLYFSVRPRESKRLYRKVNTARARANALRFYEEHRTAFKAAAHRFGVPESVLLALLQVETGCGRFTGHDRVLYRLARLASAAAPDNVEANIRAAARRRHGGSPAAIRARALKLEDTFLPHVAATITLALAQGDDPLEVRGSYGGAIGIPQFLPGNVTSFGVDGDRDGTVDLHTPHDAIFSVANFVRASGWNIKRGLAAKEQQSAIFEYNRSQPYISSVLELAQALERLLKPARRLK